MVGSVESVGQKFEVCRRRRRGPGRNRPAARPDQAGASSRELGVQLDSDEREGRGPGWQADRNDRGLGARGGAAAAANSS